MKAIAMVLLLSLACLAQPADDRAPAAVRDAVERVQQAGLMKGYPDGKLRGNRAMTRNEVAEIMDRFQRLYEDATRNFVTKGDLEPIRAATKNLRDTLAELEALVKPMEQNVDMIDTLYK